MDRSLCSQCLQPAFYLCSCQASPLILCLSCFNPHLLSVSGPHPTTLLLGSKQAYERQEEVSRLSGMIVKLKRDLEEEKGEASNVLYQLYIDQANLLYSAYTHICSQVSTIFSSLDATLSSVLADLHKPTGPNFALETTIFISASQHIFDSPRLFLPLTDVFQQYVTVQTGKLEDWTKLERVVEQWGLSPPCQCEKCRKVVETVMPPGGGGGGDWRAEQLMSYRNSFVYRSVENIGDIEAELRQQKGDAALITFRKFACELGSISSSDVQRLISLFYSSQYFDEHALRRELNESGFPLSPNPSF